MFNLAFLRSRKFFIHGTNTATVLHCSIQFRNGPSFEKSICLWLTQIYKLYRKIIVLIAYRTWEQLRLKNIHLWEGLRKHYNNSSAHHAFLVCYCNWWNKKKETTQNLPEPFWRRVWATRGRGAGNCRFRSYGGSRDQAMSYVFLNNLK